MVFGPSSATVGRAGHSRTDQARQVPANNVSSCLVGLTQDFCEADTTESLEALPDCCWIRGEVGLVTWVFDLGSKALWSRYA